MSNWHNEILDAEGWFAAWRQARIDQGIVCGICGEWTEFCGCGTLAVQNTENGKIGSSEPTQRSRTSCQFCGTRTGQHGFSFDKRDF